MQTNSRPLFPPLLASGTVPVASLTIATSASANGVAGQEVRLIKTASANKVVINHDNGGTQPVMLQAGSGSLTLSSFGGITLICNGSNWYDTTPAATYAP